MAGNKKGGIKMIKSTSFKAFRSQGISSNRELSLAKELVEKTLKSKNKTLLRYIISVAELKAKGNDYFVSNIKDLVEDAMKKGISMKKLRGINLYINFSHSAKSAEELVRETKNLLKTKEASNVA